MDIIHMLEVIVIVCMVLLWSYVVERVRIEVFLRG